MSVRICHDLQRQESLFLFVSPFLMPPLPHAFMYCSCPLAFLQEGIATRCAVQALADKVVKGIAQQEGSSDFNGVYLRMERDASDWVVVLGGKENYWQKYRDAMVRAKFSKDTPVYVASGLLTGSTDINDHSKNSGDAESVEVMKGLVKDIVDDEVSALRA